MAAALILVAGLGASGCGSSAAATRTPSPRAAITAAASASPAPASPAPASPAVSGYSDGVTSKAAATRRAVALTEAVTLPAQATRLEHSPSTGLDGDGTPDLSGPTLVQAARWWSVPGELAPALAALVAHPPAGFVVCSGACPYDRHTSADLSFWPQDDTSAQTSIGVTLVQGPGHVDVRVVGRSIWDPEPTPQERVPAGVRSVSLSWRALGSGGSDPAIKPRSGTASGTAAAQIVAALDQLQTEQPLPPPVGCYDGHVRVTARFRFGGHTLVFAWTNGNCGLTTATYDGAAQPVLEGNPLTGPVKRLLHAAGPVVAGV